MSPFNVFSFGYPVDEFPFKEMRMWGPSKIRRNQEKQEGGGVQDSSGRNLVLRQSCTQNSVKHQRLSSSAKIANSLNMLTVPAKRLHHRSPTGLQVRI